MQKPFIYAYFKTPPDNADSSLSAFKTKLNDVKHFYCNFANFNDLWNQFNKELDRLMADAFTENKQIYSNTGGQPISWKPDCFTVSFQHIDGMDISCIQKKSNSQSNIQNQ